MLLRSFAYYHDKLVPNWQTGPNNSTPRDECLLGWEGGCTYHQLHPSVSVACDYSVCPRRMASNIELGTIFGQSLVRTI